VKRSRLLLAVLLVAAAAYGSGRLERSGQRVVPDEELCFFPSGRLLDFLCMGHRTLVADLTWLSAIQYYGKHHMGDRQYPLARHLFEVTTRIDPQFRGSYIFGALVLADEAGDLEAARRFLTEGVRSNPGDWTLAFQRGFIEYMRGDRSTGALLMVRASRMPDAASYASRLAAFACSRVGRNELAARLWEEMAAGEDPALRALAEERLRDLRAPRGQR
jgi:hypothetical protein